MTTDPSSTPADPGVGAPDQPKDTKERFREALERKRQQQHAGAAGITGDPKAPGAHGAAGNHRMFRRKSGG